MEVLYTISRPILKKRTPIIKTKFLPNMIRLGEDDLFGFSVGYLREVHPTMKGVQTMILDDLLMLLIHYSLLGVELVEIEGGHGIVSGKPYQELLTQIGDKFRLRVSKLGIQPSLAEKLKPFVGGFCVDLKVVPKPQYAEADYVFYRQRFNVKRSLPEYSSMTMRLAEIVDGMDLTYYTCSVYDQLSSEDKAHLARFREQVKSPFLVGGKKL